jgi:hypothetical protein
MIGGFFSSLISIILIVYFALCVKKLVTGDENVKYSTLMTFDLEEAGEVSYNDETDLVLFAIIRKDGIGAETPYINGSANFS